MNSVCVVTFVRIFFVKRLFTFDFTCESFEYYKLHKDVWLSYLQGRVTRPRSSQLSKFTPASSALVFPPCAQSSTELTTERSSRTLAVTAGPRSRRYHGHSPREVIQSTPPERRASIAYRVLWTKAKARGISGLACRERPQIDRGTPPTPKSVSL